MQRNLACCLSGLGKCLLKTRMQELQPRCGGAKGHPLERHVLEGVATELDTFEKLQVYALPTMPVQRATVQRC